MSPLSFEKAKQRLGTGLRFGRRLIAERRISFVKLVRHVPIGTADLNAYVAAGARVSRLVPRTLRSSTACSGPGGGDRPCDR